MNLICMKNILLISQEKDMKQTEKVIYELKCSWLIHNLNGKIISKESSYKNNSKNYKVPQKVYRIHLNNLQIIT